MYANIAKTNSWDEMENSFNNLKEMNIEGITPDDIETERQRANIIKNTATSNKTISMASSLGIDPRTEDYNIFVGLLDHHE
jgi:phage terminase small subunit